MPLDLDQLRALAELKRRQTAVKEAISAYDHAEQQCWRLGISHRQIGVVAFDSASTIYRRYRRATVKP